MKDRMRLGNSPLRTEPEQSYFASLTAAQLSPGLTGDNGASLNELTCKSKLGSLFLELFLNRNDYEIIYRKFNQTL